MMQRWCTGLVLCALLYAAVMYLSPMLFLGLTSLLLCWMCVELVLMLGYQRHYGVWWLCVLCVLTPGYVIIRTSMADAVFMALMVGMVPVGLYCLWAMHRYVRQPKLIEGQQLFALCVGLYIGVVCLLAINLLRAKLGPAALLMALGLVVVVDTMAYVTGRAMGKHPLLLAVSPGKTWEGCIGGLLAGTVYLGTVVQLAHFPLSAPWLAWPMGACLAILAVWGDLIESMLKRMCGVKDSGHLLPGHGGLLDRVDGMLFVIPVFLVAYAFVPFLSI